jgi:peptidoglycan/xylan/chitin deacetylase (PgdA/CDA1 family)
VAAPAYDPFALSVRPSWFQDHLDILRSHCQLVSLEELLAPRAFGLRTLTSITFDDGYLDNLTTALPILRQARIPATFFICTGALGDTRGFWWDRLASAIAATDSLPGELEPLKGLHLGAHQWHPEARTKATLEIAQRLQRMQPIARDAALIAIEAALSRESQREREACPIMDETALRELAAQPLVELGAHTHNHAMLSVLERRDQLAEITSSVSRIQEITGKRPRFLAYPYGSQRDYNLDTCLAAKDAGLQAGFVNHSGIFDPRREPYRLPRYYVPPLPAEQFRGWLLGILRAA